MWVIPSCKKKTGFFLEVSGILSITADNVTKFCGYSEKCPVLQKSQAIFKNVLVWLS